MSIVRQFTAEEEKSLPILLRHSSETVLPDRAYFIKIPLLGRWVTGCFISYDLAATDG
jgi:hypothetical protein